MPRGGREATGDGEGRRREGAAGSGGKRCAAAREDLAAWGQGRGEEASGLRRRGRWDPTGEGVLQKETPNQVRHDCR